MKKAHLALALTGALAGTASAQSSVTISGIIGVGIASVTGAKQGASNYNAGNLLNMSQDSKVPTRLVFSGNEDLGDGLAAIFKLDQGFNVDDGSATLGGLARETYLGLKSNKLGTLTMGRQFHPLFNVRDDYDPTADSSNLMATGAFRMNNSVMYRTPVYDGLFAKLAYGFGEVAGNMSAGRAVGGHIGYDGGPVSAKLGYNDLKDSLGLNSARSTLLAGSYNFGPVTGFLGYGVNRGAVTNGIFSEANNTDMLFGARIPLGASTLAATYIRKNDKTSLDADANQIQIYYAYALSKRTVLYSIYTRIDNSPNATFTTAHAGAAPTAAQIALGARPADREFSVGIRHSF